MTGIVRWGLGLLAVSLVLTVQAQDYEETKRAADRGDLVAQNTLGMMYERGQGVVQDHSEALKWYRKAAEKGSVDAQLSLAGLGVMFAKAATKDSEITKWNEEAVKWFRRAAEKGNADGQRNLGLMYDNGRGVKKSDAEAIKWYTRAAEQGDVFSQYYLGEIYQQGQSVARNEAEAEKWYRKAADQGHKQAQDALKAMEKRRAQSEP
ncbi:MAG: sel1 repeat family protein, partial [Azoarcus sp.]|nr:sel1 repeat family protein [Azoarcus sp.]